VGGDVLAGGPGAASAEGSATESPAAPSTAAATEASLFGVNCPILLGAYQSSGTYVIARDKGMAPGQNWSV
jgi:hypothetical protein